MKVTTFGLDFAKTVFQVHWAGAGTGGRIRLLGISKRGDVYLRTLLIHGARALIHRRRGPEPWLQKLLARRAPNVAAVAVANRMARTIRALLAHDRTHDQNHVSSRPVRAQPLPRPTDERSPTSMSCRCIPGCAG
ncbi:MAG: hypothetical protein OHK0026_03370 [Rhodocyclaceae bacterium]